MTMCISYHLAYYKVARSISNPRFDGCIWGCVPPILLQLENLKVRFATHLAILKATFWQPKNIVLNKVWVPRMFSPLPLTFKIFCFVFILWKMMLNWWCKNHLISTCLPSYAGPFFHHKFLNKSFLIHEVGWTYCGASYWFNKRWVVFYATIALFVSIIHIFLDMVTCEPSTKFKPLFELSRNKTWYLFFTLKMQD
jgi:hypothetical protein